MGFQYSKSLRKSLQVDFAGESWQIPLWVVAHSRATQYQKIYDDDLKKSLELDTRPLFDAYPSEAVEWASNNMNWSDVAKYAERVPTTAKRLDRDAEWGNATKSVIDLTKGGKP